MAVKKSTAIKEAVAQLAQQRETAKEHQGQIEDARNQWEVSFSILITIIVYNLL